MRPFRPDHRGRVQFVDRVTAAAVEQIARSRPVHLFRSACAKPDDGRAAHVPSAIVDVARTGGIETVARKFNPIDGDLAW